MPGLSGTVGGDSVKEDGIPILNADSSREGVGGDDFRLENLPRGNGENQSWVAEPSCSFLSFVSRKKGAKGMSEQTKTRAARLMGHLRFSMVR